MSDKRHVTRTRAVPANFSHDKVRWIESNIRQEFTPVLPGWAFEVAKTRHAGETIITAVVTISPADYGEALFQNVEAIVDSWIDEALADVD